MTDLTYGGRAVRASFNPSNNGRVDKIKGLYANIIDELVSPNGPDDLPQGERGAQTMIAVRQAQSACMWAVSAVTFGSEPASPPDTNPADQADGALNP